MVGGRKTRGFNDDNELSIDVTVIHWKIQGSISNPINSNWMKQNVLVVLAAKINCYLKNQQTKTSSAERGLQPTQSAIPIKYSDTNTTLFSPHNHQLSSDSIIPYIRCNIQWPNILPIYMSLTHGRKPMQSQEDNAHR